MAKLNAHGKEVSRFEKTEKDYDGTVCLTTMVIMSDGVVMTKYDYRRVDGSKHSSGWKKFSKKSDAEAVLLFEDSIIGRGFVRV